MKFTYNWLQEYVGLDGVSPGKLADDLTMLGLEVDSVTPLYEELAPLRTGTVHSVEPHPDADKLTVCRVDVGDQTLSIVCGAPNVRQGLSVVVALPGTTLPGNFKIKKSKVRGVVSEGMLCSERELGLGDDHSGIIELPEGTRPGVPFLEAAGLQDSLIEVDLTPNRPDCTSVIGIAREAAGKYRKPLQVPYSDVTLTAGSDTFSVTVEAPELCPRYAARLVTGVTIGPSPWWLRKRLLAVGLRPINNVVDITNLVMLEYGQPLHAFDFQTLDERRIVVRTPRPDETAFTTLDHVSRPLQSDMLLICDGSRPVAIGGIMGGLDSEVTERTTDVLLESACFNPLSIRKTARLLKLSTDASYRFERGVDPGGTLNAMERAVRLMCELAGGTAESGGIDVRVEPARLLLDLRVSRTVALLGIRLSRDEIRQLLESIELVCREKDEDTLSVAIPSFRVDLEREADLVEEVARLIGYNRIPVALPTVDLSFPEQDTERLTRKEASFIMTRAGFFEAINYSFTSSGHDDRLQLARVDGRRRHVRILNPLSEDQDVMRTTLLPGLLENVRRNLSFQQQSCRLFEIGKVFLPVDRAPLPQEPMRIAAVLVGNRHAGRSPLHCKSVDVDIYDAKGAAEHLLKEMRLFGFPDAPITIVPAADANREPYAEADYAISVQSGGTVIGSIGKITGTILREFGIKRDVYYFDIDFTALCGSTPAAKAFSPLPVYPAVKRDIALLVPAGTQAADLVAAVLSSGEKLVERCDVFDVYQGDKIAPGSKSIALTITYRSQTKTLTEKNVEKVHAKVVDLLTGTFGGSLREE